MEQRFGILKGPRHRIHTHTHTHTHTPSLSLRYESGIKNNFYHFLQQQLPGPKKQCTTFSIHNNAKSLKIFSTNFSKGIFHKSSNLLHELNLNALKLMIIKIVCHQICRIFASNKCQLIFEIIHPQKCSYFVR